MISPSFREKEKTLFTWFLAVPDSGPILPLLAVLVWPVSSRKTSYEAYETDNTSALSITLRSNDWAVTSDPAPV